MSTLPAGLAAYAGQVDPETSLPVEAWDPPFCGHIDMRIARDGTWFHNGTPILRSAMIRLFSRLLRRESNGYVLVTPVEKVGITVEDVPFIAVEMTTGPALTFRTNAGDAVTVDTDHPLRFETREDGGFIPYVRVRGDLDARLTQGLSRDLATLAVIEDGRLGIRSANCFFTITGADQVFD